MRLQARLHGRYGRASFVWRRYARMRALAICVSLMFGVGSALLRGQTPGVESTTPGTAVVGRTSIPYVDAKLVIEALRVDLLPADLNAKTSAERELLWPGWVSRHDLTIRARVARGDEDSIFNFLLLGTTFTAEPRVTDVVASLGDAKGTAVVQQRLDDLVAGVASPGGNERLQFVRDVVERTGVDAATPAGKSEVRLYLGEIVARVVREREGHERAIASVKLLDDPTAKAATHSTLYRDRGLSSDTSIFPSFAIEQALRAIKSADMFRDAPIRRVAIVGPGLDFIDKEDGYDSYPLQTIQPFATIDSLIRLGLATPDGLQITTFDLSARVNHHLQLARLRARAGGEYVLALPRNMDEGWNRDLSAYWQYIGDRIGEETQAIVAPPNAGNVQIRAVRVRPSVVASIVAQDLNVVLQRLEQSDPRERFDLVIATNVLVYYDVFEQSLAVANLAKMLRRGGLLLSNNVVYELPGTPLNAVGDTGVGYTDSGDGDLITWYERP